MPVSEPTLSYSLRHFLTLAKRGRHPACSSGERAAYKISQVLLKNCRGLDESAICGIIEFSRLAKVVPASLQELLK